MMSFIEQLAAANKTPIKKHVPKNLGAVEKGKTPDLVLSMMSSERSTTSGALQEKTGLCRATINAALRRLVEKKLVEITGERATTNRGNAEILYRKIKETENELR